MLRNQLSPNPMGANYLNFRNQTIKLREKGKSELIYRGKPRVLSIQVQVGSIYLGTPSTLDTDFGFFLGEGGTFSVGASDLMLGPEDYIEIYAITPEDVTATSPAIVNILFLE